MIAPGLTVVSFSVAPRSRASSQAASSAIVFERAYGVISMFSGSLQSRSSSGRPEHRLAAAGDRGDRGGDDDSLDPGVEGGAQDPQRALARRHDQLVGVLRLHRREGRGDVEHVVAAGDGLGPAVVGEQVGGEHREPLAGVDLRGDRGAHLALAGEVADGRAHRVALAQQLDDAPAAEESRAAADQDGLRLSRGLHLSKQYDRESIALR